MPKQLAIMMIVLGLASVALSDEVRAPVGRNLHASAAVQGSELFRRFDGILKAYVQNGQVDYGALRSDRLPLNQYLSLAGAVKESEFRSWSRNRQLAFLINLYNASTLQLILDHDPVESIKQIGSFFKGPWDQPAVTLFGRTTTLNDLEHNIIRKQFREPRIHMALVCAAKGCPHLRSEAYAAARLEEQLADQSRRYLHSPAGLVMERDTGRVFLSSIFKWYGSDFPSIPGFVETYYGESIRGLKIRYLDYDWSLNGKTD